MRTRVGSRRKIYRLVFAVALILLAISVFSAYRLRAVEEAAEFEPSHTEPVMVPARTVIPAAVRSRIPESAEAGDTVTAFVSAPVVIDGRTVIPYGAQLKGEMEHVSVSGPTANAAVSFDVLLIDGNSLTIQTRQIGVIIPVQSDAEILGTALSALMQASIGAAIGAEARDPRVLNGALVEGAATSVPVEVPVPITVTLIRDLEIA